MTISELLSLISRNTNTLNTTTSSYTTVAKTLDINNALNQYFILANSSAGNWRPADDTNQAGYPVNVASLVSGQQDYTFTTDSDGNQILDIYKVRVLNPDGVNWTTLTQINQDTITDSDLQTVNSNTPQEYYLTANGIFLVQKPNYNMTNGLEIWVARSPVYFTAGDVTTGTKVAGIPWVHQEYLALRPSYFYCLQKQFPQARDYGVQLQIMEKAIKDYYRDRNKDFSQAITPETINSI